MQSGRNAGESIKESTANAAASARAGIEKAKATAQEKVDKMKTRNPAEKEAATMKKDERKTQAQLNKEQAQAHNEEARRMAKSGGPHPGYKTWGTEGYTTTTATTDAPLTATEEFSTLGTDYTTPGTGTATATGDPRQPTGPVRADAPRFDSSGDYR